MMAAFTFWWVSNLEFMSPQPTNLTVSPRKDLGPFINPLLVTIRYIDNSPKILPARSRPMPKSVRKN